MSAKGGWVYILTNRADGVLYTSVTAELVRPVGEHREGKVVGFSKAYGLKRLVYFERHDEVIVAIAREKAIKKWRRAWKVALIAKGNPERRDLYESIS